MKISKKFKLMSLFAITTLVFSSIPSFAETLDINNENQQKLKNVITTAYELRATSVVNKAEDKELKNFYLPNSEIYNFEKGRYKYFEQISSLSNGKIKNMKSSIKDFKIISSTVSKVNIALYEEISYNWLDSKKNTMTSYLGIPHNITLIKDNGNWKISTDGYDESDITKMKSPNFKDSDINVQPTSAPTKLQSFVNPTFVPDATLYNRSAVANYAATYWSSYNSNYCNYNPYGGDCANFASQCIHAGNAYFTGAYNDYASSWWYNFGGSNPTAKSSTTWRYCPSQVSFILDGWASSVSSASSLSTGDLIYYDWGGDGVWDHVAIVTGFDSSGNPLVTAHNKDHHNVYWTLGGASRYKFVHFDRYI